MPPALSGPLPPSIPDSQLGLSASELAILRQHQQIALASSSSTSHTTANSVSTRGRGHVRGSASTSRAASAASSNVGGGGGRLLLDAGSLAVLGRHFEGLMGAIGGRIDSLTAQTSASTISQSNRAATSIAAADAEIARFREILRQIDELETEFDKVRHIRDIVKSFRARVEGLERRVDGRAPPSHHGSSKGRGTIRR
ncbi:hypothetical protein JMJ35_010358 [Cladonia borealis]|uniref:Biogenesis of lysosome-related organelles complex 1 subunit CNL1 n=1 Tax=Cladonia borealis TaxID=184061 RepID=A0AA39QSL4_9LECA|nr:hypothetical protein JMJ35_010358 [Cladonia borealis]